MITYYSLNQYLKDQFGEKLYKISLDGGFTCPNRDGTLDTRGCIFCSKGGSGDFAEKRCYSITQQIEHGKQQVAGKFKSKDGHPLHYIAYFQAFTNTYGPIDKLRALYYEAIMHPDIYAISIATRPDCISEEVLSLLQELNAIKPVWVELGLQTIHPATAQYIRRGYDLSCFDQAVAKLRAIALPQIIVHMIIGLPGEDEKMIYETASYIGKSGASGIKLQLLHVIKDTDLATDYAKGQFDVLSMDSYLTIVAECLKRLPSDMVIHRLTGDGDKRTLIAPLWSGDKKRVLGAMHQTLLTYPD